MLLYAYAQDECLCVYANKTFRVRRDNRAWEKDLEEVRQFLERHGYWNKMWAGKLIHQFTVREAWRLANLQETAHNPICQHISSFESIDQSSVKKAGSGF